MTDSMRSLNSFGVAGLLSANAEILYSNELRARNVGRISDLLAAKLRDHDVDELRLRALLTYGLFLSYGVRGSRLKHDEEIPAISAEIGFDGSYVAVGVSFHWQNSKVPAFSGLLQRLKAGDSPETFDRILGKMEGQSSQLIIRYEMNERRIEVVALISRHDSDLNDPTMLLEIDSASAPLLEVANYTEIGDLDYVKLLKAPTLADDLDRSEGESETTIDERTPQQTLEQIEIKNETPMPELEAQVMEGALNDAAPEFTFRGNSSEGEAQELRDTVEDQERTIDQMRIAIQKLESELEEAKNARSERRFSRESQAFDETTTVVKERASPEKSPADDDWGIHFLKQVWPFAKKDAEGEDQERKESDPASEEIEAATVEGVETAQNELRELQAIANQKKSRKIEETLEEISEEAEKGKAKRWVETLSSELLQEKARLSELQKNLSRQIRQKELEFKTSELSLKQELRRKDELLRQKETALESKSDQIAQLNLAVERAENVSSDKEQHQMKVRLERAQKLAQMKEEETKALMVKVRDLENRLIIAQAKSQKTDDLQMKMKMQNLEKKVDEYKRVNQRLMESLNSQKDRSNDKEVGDLRRKIDQLDRQLNDSKRSLEKSAFKVRELQESERRLQADHARAVEENRNLRKAQARSGSSNGGGSESGGQAA